MISKYYTILCLRGFEHFADFGTHGYPGLNLLKTPRDECIMEHQESMFQPLLWHWGKNIAKNKRKSCTMEMSS